MDLLYFGSDLKNISPIRASMNPNLQGTSNCHVSLPKSSHNNMPNEQVFFDLISSLVILLKHMLVNSG